MVLEYVFRILAVLVRGAGEHDRIHPFSIPITPGTLGTIPGILDEGQVGGILQPAESKLVEEPRLRVGEGCVEGNTPRIRYPGGTPKLGQGRYSPQTPKKIKHAAACTLLFRC